MASDTAGAEYGLVLEGENLVVMPVRQPGFFDPRFLVAGLLYHVAMGDGEITEDEIQVMIDSVARHFQLDMLQAERRLSQALNLYIRKLDLRSVGNVLSEVLAPGERVDVMLMLLQVVAADGRQGADELCAVDEVAAVLGVSDEERHMAFSRYFAGQEK